MKLHSIQTYLTVLISAAFYLISQEKTLAGGVTAITHGQGADVDSWVTTMAARMDDYRSFPGTTATFYKIYFVLTNNVYQSTWQRIGGNNPLSTDSGEVIVLFDWRQLANNSYNTYQIAPHLAGRLLQTNFIEELGGRALAELPIHLIGHSRGGSLVSEATKVFGTNGIWVDQLTTLDSYARTNDAPINSYENILFHDNMWQNASLNVHGTSVFGAYNRFLNSLPGGYWLDYFGNHSDVHLWYHGTIDWRTPTSDGSAPLYDMPERYFWWATSENRGTNAGFLYSRIGGGNRMSTNSPVLSGSGRIIDGFNQHWDVGAGAVTNNRVSLPPLLAIWPNPIRCNITGPTNVAQGQSTTVAFYYQWARPSQDNATATFFLDTDANPWNANALQLAQVSVPGTTAAQVGFRSQTLTPTASHPPGTYRLFVRLQGSDRTRYLYAPELLTVLGISSPLRLEIIRESSGTVQVDVFGTIGQNIVLYASTNLLNWNPIATNILNNMRWSHFESSSQNRRFYRAVEQ